MFLITLHLPTAESAASLPISFDERIVFTQSRKSHNDSTRWIHFCSLESAIELHHLPVTMFSESSRHHRTICTRPPHLHEFPKFEIESLDFPIGPISCVRLQRKAFPCHDSMQLLCVSYIACDTSRAFCSRRCHKTAASAGDSSLQQHRRSRTLNTSCS